MDMIAAPLPSLQDLAASSIRLARHTTGRALDEMRGRIRTLFPEAPGHYSAMPIEDYRERVSAAQDELSGANFGRRIVDEIAQELRDYLQGERFLIQTNLYLRATRPVQAQETEAVGWHRETFYGANMERAVNVWTPLDGVNVDNTLRYVPGSQDIPEEAIKLDRVDDAVTKRFSAGHKIGFVYAPKIIVGGVDLAAAVPMIVPSGSSSIFSGNLIHGSGVNQADTIRFSVDFRVLPLSAWDREQSKAFHFASGKPYFEEY